MSVSVGGVCGWHGQWGRFLRGFIAFSSAGLVLHLLLPLGYLSCEFSELPCAPPPRARVCRRIRICVHMCVHVCV